MNDFALAGPGMQLFENAQDRSHFTLGRTKVLKCGAAVLYYHPRSVG